MANRLERETSPYLLQHKDNPVDWWAWNDDALERARAEGKPILLSIGYAACHWCHVMERESFEDAGIAKLMNDAFINIKVDREERPDLDAIYMEAVQAMTGAGGWPMTMFLTPEGVPFYGGTYFPPEDRGGMPSFKRVLAGVAEAWGNRRAEIEAQGHELVEHMNTYITMTPSTDAISQQTVDAAFEGLKTSFDRTYGGFGGAPKFPQPMTVDFLMRMGATGRNSEASGMAKLTLDAMAAGGMFDQLGGGFSRYSVDRAWVVPHFEKMLYDNAQLVRTYARSWQANRSGRHRTVAEATGEWMLREMRDEGGGFWSSLDADSEGVEGRFYVWTLDEARDVSGDDADAAIKRWGFTGQGNFEGKNIPVFASNDVDLEAVERARRKLLERRATRVRPATDTKVLSAWNGLAISGLAVAGAILGRSDWIAAASEAMRFVLDVLRVDGRLMRSYRRTDSTVPGDGLRRAGGIVRHRGYCEDYAFVLEGCLSLFEATFDLEWLDEARWAADEAIRLFIDDNRGGFFTTGKDAPELITRSKDFVDNAIPSANSVMAMELQRLATITGEKSYEKHAVGVMRSLHEVAARSPLGFGHLLGAIDFYVSTPLEVVVVGEPSEPDTRALLDVVRGEFNPNQVTVVADEPTDRLAGRIPLLEGRSKLNGRSTVYLCRRGTCQRPVDSVSDLLHQLEVA